jgi:ribosomal protein L23
MTDDKKVEKADNQEQQLVDDFDPYLVIKTPLSTEKSIRKIEFQNTLVFVVHPRSTKPDVKRAVEELFKVKVAKVNLHNAFQGQKRAYVKIAPSHLASDVSADLGLI